MHDPLIPEPGQLCTTLFVELTSEDALVEWLPPCTTSAGSSRPAQVATFDAGSALLVADHAQYAAEVVLPAGTVAELARDLRQGG